jgi:hypothetical protein
VAVRPRSVKRVAVPRDYTKKSHFHPNASFALKFPGKRIVVLGGSLGLELLIALSIAALPLFTEEGAEL